MRRAYLDTNILVFLGAKIKESISIKVVPVDKEHLKKFAELPLYDDHKDPGDRIIIAQAIADHVSLVSSDRKFNRYEKNSLKFLYNER